MLLLLKKLRVKDMKNLFLAALYIFINFGIYYLKIENNVNMSLFTILSLVIGIVLIGLFKFCSRGNYDVIKCFIPIAFSCGLLFMAVTPVLRGADEELHFYRSYEVSNGYIMSDIQNNDGVRIGGRDLPVSLKSVSPENTLDFNFSKLKEKISIPLNKNETEFILFTTASLYSPVQYLPQALGIFIGRIFNLNPIYIAYLGRFTNFIVWLLLCYLALKNFKSKVLMFLIPLLPMSLHTATTLSPDALTNSLSLLFISYIVRISCFEKERPIANKEIMLIFIMALGISLCKIVYLPLCLLFLIVPISKFKSKREYAFWQILLVIMCGLFNILWTLSSFKFLIEVKEGVNSIGQIKYILNNPIEYIFVISGTTAYYFNMYLHSMIGANLCLFDVPIYYWVSDAYIFLIIFIMFVSKTLDITKYHRYLVIFVAVSIFLLINTSLYIQWTPVGIAIIDGIQGRYFLPLLPLLIFLFKPIKEKNIDRIVVTSAVFLTYPVLITLLLKHLS